MNACATRYVLIAESDRAIAYDTGMRHLIIIDQPAGGQSQRERDAICREGVAPVFPLAFERPDLVR
jgi:hypothetical protein